MNKKEPPINSVLRPMKKRNFFGHNFGVVYRFEVIRTLKKKTFWASLLAFPILIAAIGGISYYSSTQGESASADLANQKFSIALTDNSGAISPEVAKAIGARIIDDKQTGISMIEAGKVDAFFYYPKDLTKDKVEVFGQNVGIFENFRYQSVTQNLLQSSVLAQTDPEVVAVLGGHISFSTQTFQDGKNYNPMMEMIAPGIFLILFFLIIVTFGGQMMNATVEEKENRVSEMILTTIKPRTLIIGKIFAFLTLTLVQVVVIIGLVVAAYFALKGNLDLPSFDLSSIPLDPVRIIVSFVIFVASLLLFSGLLVAIGAAMPTAKEANNFFAVPILLLMAPLYMVTMLITNVTNPTITFITFFPFTAPMPLMIRNAIGNLSAGEIIIGVTILSVTAVIVFIIAARLFQTGAVEYSKRMSLKGLFKKRGT
jgi:ABC-2 type transport system permease protein